MRIGRRDADAADPAGLVPGADATPEDLVQWFKRMGLGPNQLCMFAPYLYKGDEAKGVDLAAQDGTNRAVLDQYASQRKLGKRAPGPAVTIIKKFKDMTDNCIPGGNPYVGDYDLPLSTRASAAARDPARHHPRRLPRLGGPREQQVRAEGAWGLLMR